MKNLTTLFAVAAVATSIGAIGQATAAEARSVKVSFTQHDATDAHGAARLYGRIQGAAASACRDLEPARTVAGRPVYARCVRTALGDAVAELDRPAVTAYAASRGVRVEGLAIRVSRVD